MQSRLGLCFLSWVNCHIGWQSVTAHDFESAHVTRHHLLRPRSQIKACIIYLFCLVGRLRSHVALFIWQSVLEWSLGLTRQTETYLFYLCDAARNKFFVKRALILPWLCVHVTTFDSSVLVERNQMGSIMFRGIVTLCHVSRLNSKSADHMDTTPTCAGTIKDQSWVSEFEYSQIMSHLTAIVKSSSFLVCTEFLFYIAIIHEFMNSYASKVLLRSVTTKGEPPTSHGHEKERPIGEAAYKILYPLG